MAQNPVFHGEVVNPSADFLIFKRQFFDDPWTAVRGEYDRDALRRLAGAERGLAELLIEENLEVGPQFANAAADLGLVRCAPKLREMFERGIYLCDIGCALRRMGAISSERVREVWMAKAKREATWLEYPLPFCCKVLHARDAALIVRMAVASRSFDVRSGGSMALIELEDLIAGGGRYTEAMATANRARWHEIFRGGEAAARWRADSGGPKGDPERIAELVARAERALAAAERLPEAPSERAFDPHSPE